LRPSLIFEAGWQPPLSGFMPRAEAFMKAFAAALIAAGILYVVDSEFNEGRYAAVIERAIASVLPR
jgi:hypothetical protein